MNARLDRTLTMLLRYGSWFACALIGAGLILAITGVSAGARTAALGIGLFISLPPIRVLVMLVEFVRERDYRLAISAGVVLTVIGLGLVFR